MSSSLEETPRYERGEDVMANLKSVFQKITKRKKLLVLTIVIFLTAGYFVKRDLFPSTKGLEKTLVIRGEVREELTLSGEIKADEYAKLSFPTSGKISWIGVAEGDDVEKGQALAKLDTVTLNTAYQQAQSSLRAAEATVEKVHDQVKDHSADETFAQKDTRTTAEAAKDQAYEALITAEYNLRNATLVSPFAGIVTFLAHPFSGVNISVSETQLEVINPETIYFDVSADQSEVFSLSLDQKVAIVLDSLSKEDLEGEVAFISFAPKANEVGSVYKVKIKIVEEIDYRKFKIGMTGDAKFFLSQKKGVLFVPPQFVNSDARGKYLKIGKANNKTYIETGLESEEKVEIQGNIKEGDIVYD